MAEAKFVQFAVAGGAGTLTLNRPPVNVLNVAMMEEMVAAIEGARRDAAMKVLVLRGAGKCFSAGMDVGDHLPGRVEGMMDVMRRLFVALDAVEVPTVSVVHGSCLGGGFELAAVTDLTLAASDAVFGQPEIKLAVFPPVAAAWLPAILGHKRTCEMLLTGRNYTAAEAAACGLVNAVCPAAELDARLGDLVRTLTGLSRSALVGCKKAIRMGRGLAYGPAYKAAEEIYLKEVMAAPDAQEGLTAFLEKRKPVWRG